MQNKIAAIVLASGFSSRMGRNKLLLPYEGKPMIAHIFKIVNDFEWAQKIVVTTYTEVAAFAVQYGFQVVKNPSPEAGQSGSIIKGIEASPMSDGWLFLNGDMPFLESETILKIRNSCFENPSKIIVPQYNGHNGSPVYFPASFYEALIKLAGDAGGRQIIRQAPDAVLKIKIEDAGQGTDIDTLDDYKKLQRTGRNCI